MTAILYSILIFCIRTYKWLERKYLRLVHEDVERIIKSKYEKFGITLNGPKVSDPQIKDKEYYIKLASDGTLGMGEAYVDGMWDCDKLDQFFYKVFENKRYKSRTTWTSRVLDYLNFYSINLQSTARAFEVGERHYDLGNDLFETFLDPYLQYSCGYWKNANNLNEAQEGKMELVAQKLKLEPGMRVLDLGCGWGGLSKYLAQKYKVSVVGCTVSVEGAKYARKLCGDLPVEIRVSDYRDVNEKFDRVVSVGMFEHVGYSNYRTFFEVVDRCLKDDGLLVLHSIGVSHPRVPLIDPWIHTHLFPNVIVPYHQDIPKYIDGLFIMEDFHNIGYDYSKTLMAWHENFNKAWPTLSHKYGDKFFRMWNYYLLSCAALFGSRKYQLWQVVLSKNGFKGGYQAPR